MRQFVQSAPDGFGVGIDGFREAVGSEVIQARRVMPGEFGIATAATAAFGSSVSAIGVVVGAMAGGDDRWLSLGLLPNDNGFLLSSSSSTMALPLALSNFNPSSTNPSNRFQLLYYHRVYWWNWLSWMANRSLVSTIAATQKNKSEGPR